MRELRNIAERFILLGKLSQLVDEPQPENGASNVNLADQVAEFEKSTIERALIENEGSIKLTMSQLNGARKTATIKCGVIKSTKTTSNSRSMFNNSVAT